MAEQTVEQEALGMGWIPKEKFRGAPEKWTDAETYVRRGRELLPILRAREQSLTGELSTVKQQLGEMKAALSESQTAMEALTKYHQETAQRAYEKARKDLLAEKSAELKALKDGEGDPDRIVELDEAIAALDKAKPEEVKPPEKKAPPTEPAVHPDYPAWAEENKHWLSDPEKVKFAGAISNYVRAMNPTLLGRPFLDLITAEVERKYGEPSGGHKSVEGGGRDHKPRSGGGQTYEDLPAEAKAACDRMADRFVGKNKAYKDVAAWRAQYCKDYDWS